MQKSYRNCVFTLNNYTENEVKEIENWNCKFLIFGKEIAPSTGTPHIQGYVEWGSSKRIETLKNLNKRIHWEKAKGDAAANIKYCSKDGEVFQKGEPNRQGERSDLVEIKESILAGKRVDDIALESPMIFHQYGRTLNKIEDLAMRKKFRKEMTAGIWIWGPTGVGKSHKAFEFYDPGNCYVYPNDSGWWDAYTQQDTVIINDFRGEIPYNQLLQLIDKFPYTVRRRNREPLPFTSTKIIITSSLPPEKIYNKRDAEDSIQQLIRRLEIINLQTEAAAEVLGGNTNTPSDILSTDD